MKKLIPFKVAVQWCVILFTFIILFHTAIIAGIVFFDYAPVDFLWGGRMTTKEELLVFEFISLAIGALCLVVVLIQSDKIKAPGLKKVAGVALWILFVVFLLNTVGNVLAKTNFEKSFAVVTALLAVLCLRLAIENPAK